MIILVLSFKLPMKTIFHVQIKKFWPYKAHYYFGSIAAIYEDEKIPDLINISIHTLYKHDFDSHFENEFCYIFKSYLQIKKRKNGK